MVNRINVKLFFITLGLVISTAGVYMNSVEIIDWQNQRLVKMAGEELPAFLLAMGIGLSFAGVAIPIPTERRFSLPETIQRPVVQEASEDRIRLKEIELLCPKCGSPVTSDMIFCINCGKRIRPEKEFT